MNHTSNSLSFNEDMALIQMFSKEEVFTTGLPMMWKEKVTNSKTPSSGKGENRAAKRKLYSPGSASEDEDKKGTPKRRRESLAGELSPTGLPKPKTPVGSAARLTVPLSERQQLALLMQMTADKSQQQPQPNNDSVLHYAAPPVSPHSAHKRTPSDRKANKRNERGETPLHLAAIRGDVKATKKLIKTGVDVNIKDYAGWTPLHEACNKGWTDIAKHLLKAGANVNAPGLDNDLPLHDAASNGHSKLVELLLRHGANPLLQNSKGKSPLDTATSKEIIKLMKSEIVASSSSCSSNSLADVRSPTSPESNVSERDDLDQLDRQKLIDSTNDMGLLSVRHCSPMPAARQWNPVPEVDSSSNSWSGSPGNAALPVGSSSTRSRMDSHAHLSTGLSPCQAQASSQAAFPSASASTGAAAHPLASTISKKVQVSHYMDQSSSSPRLTLRFRPIKDKDGSNKHVTHAAKNVSENVKVTTAAPGFNYSSYQVTMGSGEPGRQSGSPPAESERFEERRANSCMDRNGSAAPSCASSAETRNLWNGKNCGRSPVENTDQNKNGENTAEKDPTTVFKDVGLDDKCRSISNQFEDISDAEDDRPSKPLDIGSAAKIFSQLSHIPSVSAVYQCHTNSGGLFYDGPTSLPSLPSLPLLSGLNWSNIGYGSGYGGVGSSSAAHYSPLPLATEKSRQTSESSVYSWGQGNIPPKSLTSLKTMVPLSIDTNVSQSLSYGCVVEKSDYKVNNSDLLISLPPTSVGASGGATSQQNEQLEAAAKGDLKFFIKKEMPAEIGQKPELGQAYFSYPVACPQKGDVEKTAGPGLYEPPPAEAKSLPSVVGGNDAVGCRIRSEAKVENKTLLLDVVTESKEGQISTRPKKEDETDETESSGTATEKISSPMREHCTGVQVESCSASGDAAVVEDSDESGCKGGVESKDGASGMRLLSDLKISPAIGVDLLENSNLGLFDGGASVPRVPPLKIIIPSKNGTIVDRDVQNPKAAPLKSSLPYIVNVSQNSTVEQFGISVVDSQSGKESSPGLPELSTIEGAPVGPENPPPCRETDHKEWIQTRKRKLKPSCKGFGKEMETVLPETGSNVDNKEFALTTTMSTTKGSCSSKESGDPKSEETATPRMESKEHRQQNSTTNSGLERRVTRSAVRSQQQKREKHSGVSTDVTTSAKVESNSQQPAAEKEVRESQIETAPGSRNQNEATEEEGGYYQRKHKTKHRLPQDPVVAPESHVPITPPQTFKKATNPYELYAGFKKKVADRKSRLCSVAPKLPATCAEYRLMRSDYSLDGKEDSKLDALKSMLPSSSSVPDVMKELFDAQETKRHQLRMQHIKERERLVLLMEQELLRVHGRAARAAAGQGSAVLSACTLMCAQDIHCRREFDQEDKDQRSRFNGRQLKIWMDEILEKFTNMKMELLSRHHLEADTLHLVQKLDWEWKMKEFGTCDYHSTPAIDEQHVPTVSVSDNLDLPGT